MSTFEELELAPELVEALAAEGIETPTALQRDLIPVVRRGNNVVAVAGPGSGLLVACAAPLLQRIAPEGDRPRILVLAPTPERAEGLAESLGRMALTTGHRVSALAPLWVLPERAQVLVGTTEAVSQARARGVVSLEDVEAVVVDGAAAMAAAGMLDAAGTLLEGVKADAQRIIAALPVTEAVQDFVEKHAKRSVHVPPVAHGERGATGGPQRGTVTLQEVHGGRETAAFQAVANLLTEARHVTTFLQSEDAAADLGDELLLRGYASGRPGQEDVPVWLAVDALEARHAMDEYGESDVAVLSVDVPGDADALDQRHGAGRGGTILALPREIPHVKAVAREAGYTIEVAAPAPAAGTPSTLATLLKDLEAGVETQDVDAYQVLLEPLFQAHGASAVAAAAVALLRDRRPPVATPTTQGPAAAAGAGAWVRLFVSVGKVDGVNPGDLVGAITGESGVDAKQVGKIDLRDTFSLVEVDATVAERVISSLNGVSIRGRAARVDFHREDRRGGAPSRSPRSGGGRSTPRGAPRRRPGGKGPGGRGSRGPGS